MAATVALMVIGWRWAQHRQTTGSLVISPSVVVEILGDVHDPGTYVLESPVTALQAINAAGGFRVESASPPMMPIASDPYLRSGQRLKVRCTKGGTNEMVIEPMSVAARLTLGIRLDLNKATIQELALIPAMKPLWAEVIVSRRDRQPWRHLDELQEIPGVGRRTIAKWATFLDMGEGGDLP